MKKLLIFFFLLYTYECNSQTVKTENPNYKLIKKEISAKDNPYYYKTLFNKYQTGDTTLTTKEKRLLYYGWTFQSKYNPYTSSDFSDSIRNIINKETLSDSDYLNIITYSNFIFKENPFNLRALNYALFAYDKTGQKELLNKKISQMNVAIDAILSSGDGLTKKTAFCVISINHEYDILNIIGFEFGGQQSLIEHFDYLKVKKNDYNIDGFYFDVSPCLDNLNHLFK